MKFLKIFEYAIIWILVFMMVLVLIVSIVQLGYTIFSYITDSPFHIFEDKLMMSLFGSILIVLIGIELLETIKTYLKEDVVHVEIVLLVAIIALARKIIVLDYEKYSAISLIAMALLMVALAVGYYLIKHTDCKYSLPKPFWKNDKEKD